MVTITPPAGATETYYTLDGTVPSNTNGILYSVAINVDANDGESKTLKAVSYIGSQKGKVASSFYLFDKAAPTAIITSSKEVAKNGDLVIFTAVFNEALVGTPVFTLTDGTVSNVTNPSSDKKTWKFETNNITGNVAVTATLATATDAVGNVVSASGVSTGVTGDNTSPVISGVVNGSSYNSMVTPIFEAGASATLRKNNEPASIFTSGNTITAEGASHRPTLYTITIDRQRSSKLTGMVTEGVNFSFDPNIINYSVTTFNNNVTFRPTFDTATSVEVNNQGTGYSSITSGNNINVLLSGAGTENIIQFRVNESGKAEKIYTYRLIGMFGD